MSEYTSPNTDTIPVIAQSSAHLVRTFKSKQSEVAQRVTIISLVFGLGVALYTLLAVLLIEVSISMSIARFVIYLLLIGLGLIAGLGAYLWSKRSIKGLVSWYQAAIVSEQVNGLDEQLKHEAVVENKKNEIRKNIE